MIFEKKKRFKFSGTLLLEMIYEWLYFLLKFFVLFKANEGEVLLE